VQGVNQEREAEAEAGGVPLTPAVISGQQPLIEETNGCAEAFSAFSHFFGRIFQGLDPFVSPFSSVNEQNCQYLSVFLLSVFQILIFYNVYVDYKSRLNMRYFLKFRGYNDSCQCPQPWMCTAC